MKPQKESVFRYSAQHVGREEHSTFTGQGGLQDTDHGNIPVACFLWVSEQLACMPARLASHPTRLFSGLRQKQPGLGGHWVPLADPLFFHSGPFEEDDFQKVCCFFPEVGVLPLACLF